MNLAAADICYAIFIIPTIILSHNVGHPEGVTGTVLCTIITGGNLAWIGGHASMATLLVIAVERYLAVIHPHGNKGKLTFRRLKVCYFAFSRLVFNLTEVLEPVSIVFNTSSRIPAPGMPFDWSIMTVHFNAYVSHSTWRAQANSTPGRFSLALEPGKSALRTRLARRVLQTCEVYETLLQRTF